MSELHYVYCILDAGSPALALLDDRCVMGVEPGEPVYALRSGGLVAAVSCVPGDVFEEQPLNRLTADLSRLAPYALRHEQAIRTLFQAASGQTSGALVPLTFGAVYRSAERVLAMLEDRATELCELLERLRDREEWEVKLYRRRAVLAAALARMTEADPPPVAAGPGRAYLDARLRERRMVADAAAYTATVVAAIEEGLCARAVDLRVEQLDGQSVDGVELTARFAALVPRADAGAFGARVADLNRQYDAHGFSLEVSGPWAPYSFVGGDGAGQDAIGQGGDGC